MPKDYMAWKEDFAKATPYQVKRHLETPVSVFCEFTYKTPNSGNEKPYKADLDNLCKSVLDALQDCGAYKNDSQVVELVAYKRYGQEDGIRVRVSSVDELCLALQTA